MSITTVIIVLALALIIRAVLGSRTADHHRPTGGHQRRGCRTGKVEFASRGEANRVVHRSQTDRGSGYDHPLQRSYRCPHCGYWHTTSKR